MIRIRMEFVYEAESMLGKGSHAKVIHLFLDMDRMVGKEFESGLAELKMKAESTNTNAL